VEGGASEKGELLQRKKKEKRKQPRAKDLRMVNFKQGAKASWKHI